jgi:hypothetical protein
MAIIRENARFGAALLALFATGCISTDESLFRSVEGPEEEPELSSPATSGALGGAPTPLRAEQLPATLGLGPSTIAGDDEGAAPASNADETSVPGDEAEVAMVPFDPCGAPGLLSCVTFEDTPSGEFPVGEPWLAELPGCGTHRVDEAGAGPYGAKALRADGGGYPECMLHMDLQGEADVFVRSWVRLQPELLDHYVSLLEWGPEANQDDPEVRIGSRPSAGSLCPTSPGLDVSVSGLASGSATDCTGFALEPERWYCLQAHVTRSATSVGVALSVDGEMLLERSYESLNQEWNSSGFYFKLGRAAYGASGPGALWHDDVAVGLELPPCGP